MLDTNRHGLGLIWTQMGVCGEKGSYLRMCETTMWRMGIVVVMLPMDGASILPRALYGRAMLNRMFYNISSTIRTGVRTWLGPILVQGKPNVHSSAAMP